VQLNTLRDVPGARKAKTRLGRGHSSGFGTQSGRGQKGHKARSGAKTPIIFEGGQASLALRVRKYGFSNSQFKVDYNEVTLGKLQEFIDKGRLDTTGTITMKRLVDSGVVRRVRQGLKLLSNGKGFSRTSFFLLFAECFFFFCCEENFSAKIDIEVTAASKQARASVEAAGGKLTTVYFNRLGMLTHLRNEPEAVAIRLIALCCVLF
jgi:large subunit ribosomal protein L15